MSLCAIYFLWLCAGFYTIICSNCEIVRHALMMISLLYIWLWCRLSLLFCNFIIVNWFPFARLVSISVFDSVGMPSSHISSDVALLIGMQGYFRVTCATIGYLRDAWAQYLRADVLGGEFIHLAWKSFTSRSISSIPFWGNGLPLLLGSMYPSHTRSRSTKA